MESSTLLVLLSMSAHFFILCCALDISTDQSALLALQSQVDPSPDNLLARNWSSDTPVCNWVGVTCNSRHQRVAALNISNMDLSGKVPPRLGNLSFLVSLDISGNMFKGDLPEEMTTEKTQVYQL